MTSIEPLLDDYKDAIKRKHREEAFKIKDKQFNQFYEETELRVIEEKAFEKEWFLEEISKIPSLSKKEAEFLGEELDYDESRFAQLSSDQLRELVPGLKKDVAEALIRRFG